MTRRADDNEPFALGRGRVDRSTEKALRVELGADSLLGYTSIWVPRSVIHDDSELFDDDRHAEGELVVVRWFARKEGWAVE